MSKIVPLEGFGRAEKEYITIYEDSTLNFDIVAYATEEELAAAQPKENTIGVVTTTPMTDYEFSTTQPGVYTISTISASDPHVLMAPHALSAGDVLNFTIPVAITGTYEAIRFYDIISSQNKQYCIRNLDGTAVSSWPKGTKISVQISNETNEINGWVADGTAYILAWDSYTYNKEGFIWFTTDLSSNVSFNALEDHNLQVYPIAAKQCINTVWEDIIVKSYQNGSWIDWWNGNLYKAGNEFEGVTGGWEIKPNSTTLNANCIKTDQYLQFNITPTSSACFITALPIKLDNFTKLHFECMNGTNATDIRGGLIPINQSDNFYNNMKSYCTLVNSGTATLDISAIVGKYYICFADYTTSSTYAVNISKIWLE